MKFYARTKLIIIFFSLLFLPSVSKPFTSKQYQITRVFINAQLLPDGSMEVDEFRTYKFTGSYNYSFRILPTTGPVKFQNFEVYENGEPYRLSDSKKPGTYVIIEKPGSVEVKWFFKAKNQSKTFEFRYLALGAVKRYEDAAVFYFKFISEGWNKDSRNVSLVLKPPGKLPKTSVNEWLHGPLWAESRIKDNGTIEAWCEYLPRHTYFEVKALYPADIFTKAEKMSGRVRATIMKEEKKWAEEANRKRVEAIEKEREKQEKERAGKWIVIVLSLGGFGSCWLLFRKYGKRPELPPQPKIAPDIPAKTAPVLVGYLLNSREIYGGALVSTLLDLARKGFIALREEQEKKKTLFGMKEKAKYIWDLKRDYWNKNSSDLKEYEDKLIRFIFDELGEGKDSIEFKTIRKKRNKFIKFFREWKKEVKKLGNEQNWFDRKSIRGMWYSMGIGGVMTLLTVVSAFLFGQWAIILGMSAGIVLALSFLIPHRTKEGEIQARHWKALKRYLQKYHYRSANNSILLAQIDDYFVYGVVLGLSKKVFKELSSMIPVGEYQNYLPWYLYHGGTGAAFTPETFAASFSSMIATTTSVMSTAAGTGGGASAGGGGGASSGSGGAG